MPKYLIEATYSDEGLLGLAADGAAKRLRDVKAAAKSLGGKVDAFYFSFGDSDVVGIADFPDNAAAAAFSMAATSSGAVSIRTTLLLTIEEADKAIGKLAKAKYRAPGGGQ
jgi:uncharacterized protein with GYD domain